MTDHPLWRATAPLILASGSATRRSLLAGAGIPFEAVPADVDERGIEAALRHAGAGPETVASHLAAAKAKIVAARHPGRLVLGADQVLALGDTLFAKPASVAAARDHLGRLSGRTHALHSGICLLRGETTVAAGLATARLTMRVLSDAFLDAYLEAEGDAVCGSVGAYRLEGLGIHLFDMIEGDHTTILGLPLTVLLPALRQVGVLLG